jgi:acyl carrier protein
LEPSFLNHPGGSSLDRLELAMTLDEGCEVEIPGEDAEKIRTVKDAVNYIRKRGKGGK